MAWTTIARWLRGSGRSETTEHPTYAELQATPARHLPDDLKADEASPGFTSTRDAFQGQLLTPGSRPADDAPLFTERVSARPRGVVTFALPDGRRCMPVFTTPFRADDYRTLLVGDGIEASFLVSDPRRFLRMLRDVEGSGIEMLALDRCPRCSTVALITTRSLHTVDDAIAMWAISKATERSRLDLYLAYALKSARAGQFAVAKDVALETVGHVSAEDPRVHLLLGELGVALREPALTQEAARWLRTLKCHEWERTLDAVAASGTPAFATGV